MLLSGGVDGYPPAFRAGGWDISFAGGHSEEPQPLLSRGHVRDQKWWGRQGESGCSYSMYKSPL